MDINEKDNGNDINVGNMENSIEEDIEILKKLYYLLDDVYSTGLVEDEERNEYQVAIDYILSDYKRVLKENDCLKNHVHYKKCIACGEEFRSKRSDAKYCTNCSKSVSNKNYFAHLTEEQKEKRREKVKLAMRKMRKARGNR